MKVIRADWAGSVPWSGITGKPAGLSPSAVTDLTQLTARVAALETAVNSLTGTSTGSSAPLSSVGIWWAVGTLEPLQMAYEDLAAPVEANASLAVGAPFAAGTGVFFEAYSLGTGVVRLVAVNLSGATVTLPMASFTIFVLHG